MFRKSLKNRFQKTRFRPATQYGCFQRYLVLDTSRTVTPKPKNNTSDEHLSEPVEYVLLPHNDEVIKPRALNTFLDGLAELGVDKRLKKNKKILGDLLEKEMDPFEEASETDVSDDEHSNDEEP